LSSPPSIETRYLELYEQEMPKVYRFVASRVNSKALAEDITSESFMRTWDYLREGGKIENMRAFVYRVANNLIIDHYRSKRRTEVALDETHESISAGGEHEMRRNADVALLQMHLNNLPDDYATILTYRFVEDMGVQEIAKLTGKSSANIYVIIHRAVKLLRKRMN